ncbi:hydantoinase/oxoprolinase family protein [Mesobacterium sp. TK19101]|uniref:Hydantoinase/oxoprolinase family protein n=1 Tax=Mesobacterium hydrothermale TaxID=3111907 RepID=A0ABU6HFN5_9RHOB|nr:hydantoinase/oxoprolinase family protein [Mesobacterium sp. TK19101]MEC3861273.1 hydantoinase/oxoprolinase family protein [Mesobacterium sp. TK19101]
MAILLGVDTGGTYTDAVLIRDEAEVLASAKSLTTRHDLADGITAAVRAVLDQAGVAPDQIAMASLSTTLATNALVEGHGQRVGLVFIGFAEKDLDSHGLSRALAGDPVIVLDGGHSHAGAEVAPLDLDRLADWARAQPVSAFAVAAQFATRNPAHEVAARETLRRVTGRPVTCSHELSARLGGPKRALTAVLNARLIGLTHRLIGRADDGLRAMGIDAPLMVVRGDGALMSAAQAMERPIETILSGPAASIVGARWLTGADEALVSDIGGTTTDIALLRDGRPAIDPAGARVGGWRTMVEAVAMRTHGLGGDSVVVPVTEGLQGGVTLGPRRVLPVSLVAQTAPDAVIPALEEQLARPAPSEHDGQFALRVQGQDSAGLAERDQAVLDRLGDAPVPVGKLLRTRLEGQALTRLVDRGLVQVSGVTPTDAAHVLGRLADWNIEAAELALRLMARRRVGHGGMLAPDPQALGQMIIDQLTRQTALALLQSAFAEDGWDEDPDTLSRHPLLQRALSGYSGLLTLNAALAVPVIGLGASAGCYYPAVGNALNAQMILPRHAEVANAIGAVVGRITVRRSGTVTAPSEGRFRVHLAAGPEDFGALEEALTCLQTALECDARAEAEAAGAAGIACAVTRDVRLVQIESREVFVEAELTVEASGRARVAD